MWTRVRNHLVWHEPWVYVQLPEQEIEYMQMLPEKRYVPVPLFERVQACTAFSKELRCST